MVDIEKLRGVCETALQAAGYELVDLEYVKEGHGLVLRLYIDHPFLETESPTETVVSDAPVVSKITHADCQKASDHVGMVLDVEDIVDAPYRLEVSSPGVNRPVRKKRDFERFVGRTIKVSLNEPLAESNRRHFQGRLQRVREDAIEVDVEGQPYALPLRQIKKARLEVSF